MSDLKPCPFCGGEARLLLNAKRKIYGKDEYRIGVVACCNVCEARMFYGSEKLAIEAWNRRVPEEQQMLVLSPDLTDKQVRDLFDKLRSIQPTVIGAHLTDVDLMELRDRFGKEVADVVADMISGEEKRWNHE